MATNTISMEWKRGQRCNVFGELPLDYTLSCDREVLLNGFFSHRFIDGEIYLVLPIYDIDGGAV